MQPRSNNMQRLEAHFNPGGGRGQQRPAGNLRLDDSPLDALGGSRASSSVANEVPMRRITCFSTPCNLQPPTYNLLTPYLQVRASALKETAMRAAGKDKMDRATVEQAIDPRTRMVRLGLFGPSCIRCTAFGYPAGSDRGRVPYAYGITSNFSFDFS